jgi:hypothetical protein
MQNTIAERVAAVVIPKAIVEREGTKNERIAKDMPTATKKLGMGGKKKKKKQTSH